jgi:hypothetical protein
MPATVASATSEAFQATRKTPWYTPGSTINVTTESKSHSYGTLDNVPEFATRSLGQLYSVCFGRFEHYDGVITYGPRSGAWPQDGYWGRQMVLHSQEMLQLRFWPKTLLSDTENDPPVIRMLTKVSCPNGDSQVACYVGFQKTAFCNEKDEIRLDIVEAQRRIVGCKGLHVFMASLFKRHNVPQTVQAHIGTRACYDRFGYESLRSTSYSVHKTDRRQLEKTVDHQGACSATPGASMLMIAGEIVDVHLEPTGGRICQPIAQKKWQDNAQFIKAEILHGVGGEIAGIQAIGAASCIVDHLSAEGLVSLLTGDIYKGAMPDRLAGPHGMPLTIAMAVNLAINWELHKLPRPSGADIAANDQLRMVLQSAGYGPLPNIAPNCWCIDVVVLGAIDACEPDISELKRQRGLPATAKLAVIDDQKCFWQRVGQRLITSFFGLGAVVPRPLADRGGPGVAWRTSDPLQLARDRHLAGSGCCFEGVDVPLIPHPASFGERKASLVKMLMDVENWLRCGEFEDTRLSAQSTPEEVDMHVKQIRKVILAMMERKTTEDFRAFFAQQYTHKAQLPADDREKWEKMTAKAMEGHYHLSCMGSAMQDCKEALLHGPAQHFKYMCGAYVVARTQTSPCCDCLAPVHVLSGIMLGNAYAECTACHAKRCLSCTEAYAKAVRVQKSQFVGKRCRCCGAEPAWVTAVAHTDCNTGEEMMQIHLGERTPVRTDTALDSLGDVGRVKTAPVVKEKDQRSQKVKARKKRAAAQA